MNSVKIAYIVCLCVLDIFVLSAAIITPVYITPGNYWWSVILILLLLMSGFSFSHRLDRWGL